MEEQNLSEEEIQQTFGTCSIQNISEQYYLSGDSNISNEKMNIVSAMNSAYSYMNNVTIGFTEDQITYFKLLTKLWMIQWNKRIMAQIARLQLIIRQRRAILAQNIFWSVLLQIPKADGVVFVE